MPADAHRSDDGLVACNVTHLLFGRLCAATGGVVVNGIRCQVGGTAPAITCAVVTCHPSIRLRAYRYTYYLLTYHYEPPLVPCNT